MVSFETMETEDVDLQTIMEEFIDDPTEATGILEESVAEFSEDLMQAEELDVGNENTENQVPKPKTAKPTKVCELPLSKIKGIMKLDPEVVMVGSEAVFAVAKATELFLQTLAKQSFKHTAAQKKKTVQRSHVDSAVTGSDGLFFLEDALD